MSPSTLQSKLKAVDWHQNIDDFFSIGDLPNSAYTAANILSVWSRQIVDVYPKNPANVFISEMQSSMQQAVTLCALALYKPSAAAVRAVIEASLYFSFFKDHLVELSTLKNKQSYWVQKDTIIEYHKQHSPRFAETQDALGVLSRMNEIYKKLSTIVHGQIPGVWTQKTLVSTKTEEAVAKNVIELFVDAVDVVHRFFLCTVAQDSWDDFSSPAKKTLLKGISGDHKTLLGLDAK